MPFWKVYHSADTLTPEDKAALAKEITDWYCSSGLPAFYVNILYLPLSTSNFYTSGKPESKKVTIEILHIARNWDAANTAMATRMKTCIDRILKPYTLDKGIHLEFAINDSSAALWRINGIDPPEGIPADQKELAETNKKLLEQSFA